MAAVTLFAFVVRVLRLDFVNFHSDEAFFIQIAYQGSFMGSLGFNEPHPPLFLALLQGWMGLAGVSAFAIRLLPVLYGTLLAPVTYQLGRLIGSRRLGLAGAFVVAANPVFIFYAREVRNNGLMAFTGALSFVLLLLALRRPALLPAYVVAALAALFSHYYDIPIVGLELVVGAIWLWQRGKLRPWPWAAVPSALAAGFAPWLLYARSTVANYDVGRGTWQVFWANLVETYQAFNFGFSVRPGDLPWPSIVVGGLVVLGVAGSIAIRRRALWLVLAYALTPLAFGAATLLHQTNFNPRYLFAGAPAYALLLGAALVLLWRWQWAAGALGGLFLLGITGYSLRNVDFTAEFQPNGYREMVAYLARHAVPQESVVLDGVSQSPLYFYYGQLQARLPERVEFLPRDTLKATQATVDELLARGGVWYLESDLLRYDPHHNAERLLAADGYQASDLHFAGQRLEYFAGLPSAGSSRAAKASLNGMRLTGISAPDQPVSAGRSLGVELDWQREAGPARPFKLSLRLEGPDGAAAQNDTLPLGGYADFTGWAPGQTLRERAGLIVPVGAIPGAYTLRALVYDASSGQALGPAIDLGSVTVDHAAPQVAAAAELPAIGVSFSAADRGATPSAGAAASSRTSRDPSLEAAPAGGPAAELRLEAAKVPANGITPGDRVPITLLWSGGPTAEPRHVSVAIGGQRQDHLVGGDRYPTTAWLARDVVRDVISFRVRPSLEAGDYPVSVDDVPIGSVHVLSVARSFTPPPLAHEVHARFGLVAELLGYDAQHGDGTLHVQLIWRALSDGDTSYTVFVHALGPDGKVIAQADVAPGTDRWVKGQVVTTAYELPALSSGYRLEIGLYDAPTGQRLPIGGGADSVLLP